MPTPQSAPLVPIQVPLLGLNKRDPLEGMDPNYAPWLVDFDPEPQFYKLRGGYQIHNNLSSETAILGLHTYGNASLFAYVNAASGNHQIYNVTTAGAPSSVETTDEAVSVAAHKFRMKGQLGFATDIDSSQSGAFRYYDGSTWTDWGFQYSAADIGGRVVTQYKGRVYTWRGVYMYYSEIDAITGTVHARVDISSLFDEVAEIRWAGVLASPRNTEGETLLCYGNSSGEIVCYAGDYPEATNWEMVAKFKTGMPLYWQCVLPFRNDLWLGTDSGVLSLRKLFEQGSDVSELYTVSAPIDPYINKIVRGSSVLDTLGSMAYWPERGQVWMLLKGHLDSSDAFSGSSATMFVYNVFSGAWTIHKIPGISSNMGALTYMNNAMYFFTGKLVVKYNPTSFKDEQFASAGSYQSYTGAIHFPYSDFQSKHRWKRVRSFQPVFKTDFTNSNVTMQGSADFGRKTSGSVTSNFVTDDYIIGNFPAGVEGQYIQPRISVTADANSSDGFELYAMGVSIT